MSSVADMKIIVTTLEVAKDSGLPYRLIVTKDNAVLAELTVDDDSPLIAYDLTALEGGSGPDA